MIRPGGRANLPHTPPFDCEAVGNVAKDWAARERSEQEQETPTIDAEGSHLLAGAPRGGLRRRGDGGQVGGMEVLPLGFLMFVSVTLMIANAWGVIDAKLAVTAAAREAVRAYVEADEGAAAAAARRRAVETLDAYGRGGDRATVGAPVVHGQFRRCARVTLTVTYDLPAVAVPFIGGLGHLQPVASTYTEVIDPFRSGLPVQAGEAPC